MSDAIESVRQKVHSIFRELVGDRAICLDGSEVSQAATDAVTAALITDYDVKRAADIALHMTDWNWDAAFIVALHLFPERFTAEEIDQGISLFLVHAPNHIREACRLTNTYVWESFPDPDEGKVKLEITSPCVGISQFPGKGRGVVATFPFQPGQTIERLPVIVLPAADVALIRQTRLANYYFEWGDDCKHGAIALGYGSLYNHSYDPNACYEFREDEECLEFIALRDIRYGEEITINYNNLGASATEPVKFKLAD